jgi:hypothetical protein
MGQANPGSQARSHFCYYFELNFILRLYGNRAGRPQRDPASKSATLGLWQESNRLRPCDLDIYP